jgi:hypothetical protein
MINNGSTPASPVECSWYVDEIHGRQTGSQTGWAMGLTKREAFAMAAMQGLCANDLFFRENVLRGIGGAAGMEGKTTAARILAMVSVQHADALLAALDQEPTP